MFTPKKEVFNQRLQRLIDVAYKTQWSPEEMIDWQVDIVIPNAMTRDSYIDMVSQLYYAEEATIELLGKLITTVPDLQAKQYLCTQAIDEARHAQVYRRYLERLGDIAEINEGLKFLLQTGLTWSGNYCANVIVLNVVMEGEAVKQQKKRIDTLPCPLFTQINQTIVRDEFRHAAFGKIYMAQQLPELNQQECHEIYLWVKELWKYWSVANNGRYEIQGAEILQTDQAELEERWYEQQKVFEQIGLCKSYRDPS